METTTPRLADAAALAAERDGGKRPLKVNFDAIPEELQAHRQWVTWRIELRNGKLTKVPYSPATDRKAESDNPATWGTFSEAVAAYQTGRVDGIGFVFSPKDPYAGVDLDHSRNPTTGEVERWALDAVHLLNSYTEVSPSGTGLHILVRGRLPEGRRRSGHVEVYDDGRYFTMTGQHLDGTPGTVEDRQAELEAYHAATFGKPQDGKAEMPGAKGTNSLSDLELISRASAASGNAGPKFAALWRGDTGGYASQSEADLALCSYLAFWTNGDAARIDSLFRQSRLWRPKWDERHGAQTYGQATIEKALSTFTEGYTGPAQRVHGGGPDKPAADEGHHGGEEPADEPSRAVVVKLADVTPEPVRWLWPGRIPLGKLSILDGDPGLGKSLITLDLAARVSAGRPMPDGTLPDLDGPAGVVLLTAEDDPGDTVRPRLDAAGADCSRIAWLQAVTQTILIGGKVTVRCRMPTLTDVDAIAEAIRVVDARLVVVDPVMAFMTGDTNVDSEVRKLLARLAALARETGAAIVVIRHLNKMGGGNPLYRGGGSIGFIASARAGLLVAPDPDDETGRRRVLAATKCNLAELPPALAYHLEPGPSGIVRVVWEGPTSHTAADLLAQPADGEAKGALDEAKEFLNELLADGPTEAKVVKTEAREAAISDATLRRAKAALGVVVRKVGGRFGSEAQRWEWTLPDSSRPSDLKVLKPPRRCSSPEDEHLLKNAHLQAGCQPATDPRCAVCGAPSFAKYIFDGQYYCTVHIPDGEWGPVGDEEK